MELEPPESLVESVQSNTSFHTNTSFHRLHKETGLELTEAGDDAKLETQQPHGLWYHWRRSLCALVCCLMLPALALLTLYLVLSFSPLSSISQVRTDCKRIRHGISTSA